MTDNFHSARSIPVWNSRGREVGRISDCVLRKEAHGSKHMLKNPLGWAWDEDILAKARDIGAEEIEIFDKDSGITYVATLAYFERFGIFIDCGYGLQRCLPLRNWRRIPAETSG